MLFHVRKDDSSLLGSPGEVVFHTPRETGLLITSNILLLVGVAFLFQATPRFGAELEAASVFLIAIIFLICGGLTAEIIFRRREKRMDVRWTLFNRTLFAHAHPYSAVVIRARALAAVSSAGRISYQGETNYSAEVGGSRYLLLFPDHFPATEEELKLIRSELGFDETEERDDVQDSA